VKSEFALSVAVLGVWLPLVYVYDEDLVLSYTSVAEHDYNMDECMA